MPPPRTPDPSAYPNPSVPSSLLSAYRAAPGHPPISRLLAAAMRAYLAERGLPVPPAPPPTRTARAAEARTLRRGEERGR